MQSMLHTYIYKRVTYQLYSSVKMMLYMRPIVHINPSDPGAGKFCDSNVTIVTMSLVSVTS